MIYDVVVLLDDGAEISFQILAASPDAAEEIALQQAIEFQYRPAEATAH